MRVPSDPSFRARTSQVVLTSILVGLVADMGWLSIIMSAPEFGATSLALAGVFELVALYHLPHRRGLQLVLTFAAIFLPISVFLIYFEMTARIIM